MHVCMFVCERVSESSRLELSCFFQVVSMAFVVLTTLNGFGRYETMREVENRADYRRPRNKENE